MNIRFHPHAQERMIERGATEEEVRKTIDQGEKFPARFGRTGFRRNFPCQADRHGRTYSAKQIEACAIDEEGWLVITVVVKYF